MPKLTQRLLGRCLALAIAISGGVASAGESFPIGDVFKALVADPLEPRTFISSIRVEDEVDRFHVASVGLGKSFGFYRWPGARPGDGWQIGVFGTILSQFNLDTSNDELVNSDFFIGVPLTFRRGAFSARARLWHQSSHLGDELILAGRAPVRIDVSFEVLDALVAWERGPWRGYGGGLYTISREEGIPSRTGLQAGMDYVGSREVLAGGRWLGGIDVKWLETRDWKAGISAKMGLAFGRPAPERRGLTVLVEAYDGFVPFGQFVRTDVTYYGAALQFDF
jgi:hypothetical protein